MPTTIIPIVVSQPQSAGPAIFQMLGILGVLFYFVISRVDRRSTHSDEDETKLREQVRREAQAHYERQALRFEQRPRTSTSHDPDRIALIAAAVFLVVGVTVALICMWR